MSQYSDEPVQSDLSDVPPTHDELLEVATEAQLAQNGRLLVRASGRHVVSAAGTGSHKFRSC
jgi:hypothetical protein